MNYKIFNSKQTKRILEDIKKQFEIKDLDMNYGFIEKQDKIYIVSKDLSKVDYLRMRINSIGLYFCTIEKDGIRLSIEGSQIVGKNADKFVFLDEDETRQWFLGKDIENKIGNGYVIVRNKKDILGCGKVSNGKLYNYVPKERRLNII